MNILIAIDGSEGSFFAAELAGKLLDPTNDRIVLYYAPPEIRIPAAGDPNIVETARTAISQAVFQEAVERLPANVRDQAETIVGTQKPTRGILLAAEDTHADLIAMGAHGAGGTTLALGNVTSSVVNSVRVPVLVARPRADEAAGENRALHVLVAYDGSLSAREAAAKAAAFYWTAGTKITLFSVIEPMLVGDVPVWVAPKVRSPAIEAMAQSWVHEHARERSERAQEMRELASSLGGPFASAEIVVAEGIAREKIVEATQAQGVDLLIVGARGLGAWERFFLGSTTEAVMASAPCSVLVVHERERP